MQDPTDESALFGQSQASIDWSSGDAQFAHTNKINDLLTQLLNEFNGAKEANYLNRIFEDEEIAVSLQNLAAFLPSYVSPNELHPISSGIAEIKKLVELALTRPDTINVSNPANTSINGSIHAPQFSQVVIDTGRGIPGGYAGKGTTGTGTGRIFCTLGRTRTRTRQTRPAMAGINKDKILVYLAW